MSHAMAVRRGVAMPATARRAPWRAVLIMVAVAVTVAAGTTLVGGAGSAAAWPFLERPDGMQLIDDMVTPDFRSLARWVDAATEQAYADAGFRRQERRSFYALKSGGLDVVVTEAADPAALLEGLDRLAPSGPGRPFEELPGAVLRATSAPLGDGAVNHTVTVAWVQGPYYVEVAGWGYNSPTAMQRTMDAVAAQQAAMAAPS